MTHTIEMAPTAQAQPQANADADDSKTEDFARAQQAGWKKTKAFDYHDFQNSDEANWHGLAPVYEWKDEYGDVAPANEALEQKLFGGEFILRRGEHFDKLSGEVVVECDDKFTHVNSFEEAGLHPVVLNNVRLAQYDQPTPIQKYVIPAILKGHDVVATSQTGSGKTAAYMIPILSKLMGKAKKLAAPRPDSTAPRYNPDIHQVRAEPLVVVVVPSRELAMQIFDEARRMCYRSMLRPCVLYGGMPTNLLRRELGKGCDILIATPGRLCDLMSKPHVLTMRRVKYTIIDEADEMLHSDWEDELRTIMSGGDTNEDADHVYAMFSATFPKAERALARQYLASNYVRIRVGRAGSTHKNIQQEVFEVDKDVKREAIYDMLLGTEPGRILIYCNSKLTVDLLDDYLYNRGLPTTSIHADRNQREREDSLRAFRSGDAPIMISTGVSSRGWDVMGIKLVVNYDLPSTMYGGIDEYVHRIGRTARMGHLGKAFSFYVAERDEGLAQDLVNVLVECNCPVPDFLVHLTPEDGTIHFDDDAGDENKSDEADGGGWGSTAAGGDDAWGSSSIPAANSW